MNDQSYITYNYDLDLDLGLLSDNISDYNFCHILFIPYEAHGPAARAAAIRPNSDWAPIFCYPVLIQFSFPRDP